MWVEEKEMNIEKEENEKQDEFVMKIEMVKVFCFDGKNERNEHIVLIYAKENDHEKVQELL